MQSDSPVTDSALPVSGGADGGSQSGASFVRSDSRASPTTFVASPQPVSGLITDRI